MTPTDGTHGGQRHDPPTPHRGAARPRGAPGGLAASDVAGREAALDRALGPTVAVVVARTPITAGTTLDTRRLTIRHVPARFAPRLAYASPVVVAGARAATDLQPGEDLTPSAIDDGSTPTGAPVRPGERVAELVADGPASLIHAGSRVDVLVTRSGADGRRRARPRWPSKTPRCSPPTPSPTTPATPPA